MRTAVIVLSSLFLATTAFAQETIVRLKGTVTHIEGASLTLTGPSGIQTVKLGDNYQAASLSKATIGDILPGMFIGAGARPQPDGSLDAVQIVLFPENMRGTGEGHRAWGVMPEATMTNATVADAVTAVSGQTVTLKYPGGEKKLAITPAAHILKLAPASKSDIVDGAPVQLNATKAADGSLTATRVTLLKDGVEPM